MITREQVADLREGDVVKLVDDRYPGVVTEGPVTVNEGLVRLGTWLLTGNSNPNAWHLTVISRAPRPLYVNHPRTELVQHDVVGDADDRDRRAVWLSSGLSTDGDQLWVNADAEWCYRADLPARLRLLVDGTTGQVVPS